MTRDIRILFICKMRYNRLVYNVYYYNDELFKDQQQQGIQRQHPCQ
jgi:hypothetical protein